MLVARTAATLRSGRAPGAARPAVPVALVADGPSGDARPTSGVDLATRLLRRLDSAMAHHSHHTMAALRAAVTDLVDQLRADGLPVERVVTVVETLLSEHGAARWGPTLHVDGEPSRSQAGPVFHARLLDWCVRAYHDDGWW